MSSEDIALKMLISVWRLFDEYAERQEAYCKKCDLRDRCDYQARIMDRLMSATLYLLYSYAKIKYNMAEDTFLTLLAIAIKKVFAESGAPLPGCS